MSRILGRTAILPNIYEHYSQLGGRRGKKQNRAFLFTDVFDSEKVLNFTKASPTQRGTTRAT